MHAWYDVRMSERITISLPADLVDEIDGIASASGASRSAVIREASARYVADVQRSAIDARREAAVDDTLAFLEKLRQAPVLDERPVVDILRELRGTLETEPERP
jgi:predicted transcriptional regulator